MILLLEYGLMLGFVVTVAYFTFRFLKSTILSILKAKRMMNEDLRKCQLFYDQIKNGYQDLEPAWETLGQLYDMTVKEGNLGGTNLEKLMMDYDFYDATMTRIIDGDRVRIEEMHRLARIHLEFMNWVKTYNNQKGLRAVNFPAMSLN